MKINVSSSLLCGLSAIFLAVTPAKASTVVLYDQGFENPNGFINSGGDFDFGRINALYSNQPPGFTFTEQFTVDALLITGDRAFGTGYSDPSGIGGNYAIGMLSDLQNDLLGLSFDVEDNDFLNVSLDISSIDLDSFGGPFLPPDGTVPVFEFTLFDNPTGTPGLGSGTVLSSLQATGTQSARNVFDWTDVLLALDASGSTNGNVILRIDLLSGGYAAFDNLRIAASDTAGDVGESVPEPGLVIASVCFALDISKILSLYQVKISGYFPKLNLKQRGRG